MSDWVHLHRITRRAHSNGTCPMTPGSWATSTPTKSPIELEWLCISRTKAWTTCRQLPLISAPSLLTNTPLDSEEEIRLRLRCPWAMSSISKSMWAPSSILSWISLLYSRVSSLTHCSCLVSQSGFLLEPLLLLLLLLLPPHSPILQPYQSDHHRLLRARPRCHQRRQCNRLPQRCSSVSGSLSTG